MKLHLLFLLTSHPFTFQRKKKFKSSTCYLLTDDWPSRRVGHGKQPMLRHDVFNGQQVNLNHKCTFPLYHLIVFNLIKVDLPEPLPSFNYELSDVENVIWIYTRPLAYPNHPDLKTISTNVNWLLVLLSVSNH